MCVSIYNLKKYSLEKNEKAEKDKILAVLIYKSKINIKKPLTLIKT